MESLRGVERGSKREKNAFFIKKVFKSFGVSKKVRTFALAIQKQGCCFQSN
jgi:hypothetical protein